MFVVFPVSRCAVSGFAFRCSGREEGGLAAREMSERAQERWPSDESLPAGSRHRRATHTSGSCLLIPATLHELIEGPSLQATIFDAVSPFSTQRSPKIQSPMTWVEKFSSLFGLCMLPRKTTTREVSGVFCPSLVTLYLSDRGHCDRLLALKTHNTTSETSRFHRVACQKESLAGFCPPLLAQFCQFSVDGLPRFRWLVVRCLRPGRKEPVATVARSVLQ